MTAPSSPVQVRTPSPALLRKDAETGSLSEAAIRRRIGWIWALLFLNVLPYTARSPILHLPVSLGKIITQVALGAALLLALSINRRVTIRPNLFLILMTVLCVTSLMMSVRGYFGISSVLRAARLMMMVGSLWLLTPWWGRRDLLLFRFHRRVLYGILAIVLLGAAMAPGPAFAQAGGGRLGGVIWSIPPTQVADYAGILGGTTVILWFTGLMKLRPAAIVTLCSVAILMLTHTRTALIGLLVAVLVAALSLFLRRKQVRTALAVTFVIGGLVALSFAPFLTSWFFRGESLHELKGLTGRTTVWSELAAQPRSELHTLFGYGMSNDSFNGLSIDSSWYSAYLDQGLVGDVIDGGILLALLLVAALRPPGPRRAIALFLVVYCAISSITETGLGQATSYLLDLAIAASVLMMPIGASSVDRPRPELPSA